MVPSKSLDEYKLIAALLHDVSQTHGFVFNTRSLKLTLQKVEKRFRAEGIGFFTKSLPRLGKAFDKALTGDTPLNGNSVCFECMPGSQLPRFLGELFSCVLYPNGTLLPHPCAKCVATIRNVLYLFYKYELPYNERQEHDVIQKFQKTENDMHDLSSFFAETRCRLDSIVPYTRRNPKVDPVDVVGITREARILLAELFASFDPHDIYPKHGPGAVSTGERLWTKFEWTNVSSRITEVYPLDAYFYASQGHVCDCLQELLALGDTDRSAKVILVPKDSRGPRLISCEPVDFQWIQQGLGRAIVKHVERHPMSKWNVRFTSQRENQIAALFGSRTGKYSTLDLNEASDRVHVELVRLLFPEHLLKCLMACRSLSTKLPSGEVLPLSKFAPMGSCLCFPIMAVSIWSLLTAGTCDADTRESIYVYGDDVIVPTAYAERAMNILESFGLKINRDKSCTKGLFRESCGTDAFNGVNVTPIRLRTVWSSTRCPSSYTSWVAYANAFYDKKYFATYNYIVGLLHALYGAIPSDDMNLTCPSLRAIHVDQRPHRTRINKRLQKREYYVWEVKSRTTTHVSGGWNMLLRFFSERASSNSAEHVRTGVEHSPLCVCSPLTASQYTDRGTSMLVRRWR